MNTPYLINDHLPLIAIIRGVKPSDVIRVAQLLIDESFTMIEVPLNSPDALESIKRLVEHFGDNYLIGAGTVTTIEEVKSVIATGANLIVTPNLNKEVIKLALAANCQVFPGVLTPSEAFNAIDAGATSIKIFPVTTMGIDGMKALMSVLPKHISCFPVGGIEPTVESMQPYMEIGAQGFGLGSALYKPSMSDKQIQDSARNYVKSYVKAFNALY